jgi:hypothetical protein
MNGEPPFVRLPTGSDRDSPRLHRGFPPHDAFTAGHRNSNCDEMILPN